MVWDTAVEFDQRGGNRFRPSTSCASIIPLGIRSIRKSALVAGPGVSALKDVAIGYPVRHLHLDGHSAENDVCIGDADFGFVINGL